MIRARDSFLHFINDNLPAGSKLHGLRRDPNDRAADALSMNAVNVSFLNLTAGNETAYCNQQVVIDVVCDDEDTCVDWVNSLLDTLRAAFYTPLADYSNPTSPVPTGTNIIWDRKRLTFRKVAAEAYSHYSCLVSLKFISN